MNNWHELTQKKIFAIRFGNLLLHVTDDHIRHQGKWILMCLPYFPEKELDAKTKDQALSEAVGLVSAQVKKTSDALALFQQEYEAVPILLPISN